MATKKKPMSMLDEDKAFFMNAYKHDPKAKAAMDADMKKKDMTYNQYFGIKKKPATKTAAAKKK